MEGDTTLAITGLAIKPLLATARRDNATMAKAKPAPHSLVAVALERAMKARPELDSQNALAKKSGVGQTTIGRILRGETDPSTEVVRKLARALQVPIATLFGEAVPVPELTAGNAGPESGGASHPARLTQPMIADTYTGLQWPFKLAGLEYDPDGDAHLLVLALTWALEDSPATMAALNEAIQTAIAQRTGAAHDTDRLTATTTRRPRAAAKRK